MDTSALVIPVPRVAPLVEPWRSRHDPSAAMGVPPHVTIVAPMLSQVTHADLAVLEQLVGREPATSVELAEVGMFDEAEVLHLLPDDPSPFHRLADAVRARFPEAGGSGDPATYVPHVTVGHRIPRYTARHAARSLLLSLPIRIPVEAAQLWVTRPEGGAFPLATFPLGADVAAA